MAETRIMDPSDFEDLYGKYISMVKMFDSERKCVRVVLKSLM